MFRVAARELLPGSCFLPQPLACERLRGEELTPPQGPMDTFAEKFTIHCEEAQLDSWIWKIDLFARCPRLPLSSSITVSSVLIILSNCSTSLAWQPIEWSFPQQKLRASVVIHGRGCFRVGVEVERGGGWLRVGGWSHWAGLFMPGQDYGHLCISLQCLTTTEKR